MWESISSFLSGMNAQAWLLCTLGLAVTGLCLVFARPFFRGRRPAPKHPQNVSDEQLGRAVSNRRVALRRRGNAVTVDVVDPLDPATEITGWVIDRSTGGLRLETECELPVEATLSIRPRTNSDQTPWTAVVVRSCTPEGGVWQSGLQFVKTPTYNVLMLFG
jgi:hypothetical protein